MSGGDLLGFDECNHCTTAVETVQCLACKSTVSCGASLNDRLQFIRGAFDIGYDSSIFREEECGIGHKSKIKLEMIQSILWSLGIKSFIENISVENPFGWLYRLTVQEDMIVFPNLFYNNDNYRVA